MKSLDINKKYKPLFYKFGEKDIYSIRGGIMSGKTFATNTAIIKQASEKGNQKIFILAQYSTEVKMCELKDIIDRFGEKNNWTIIKNTLTNKNTKSYIEIIEVSKTNKHINKIRISKPNVVVVDDLESWVYKKVLKLSDFIETIVFTYNIPPKNIIKYFYIDGKLNKYIKNVVDIYTSYKDNTKNIPKVIVDKYIYWGKGIPNYYNKVILGKFN